MKNYLTALFFITLFGLSNVRAQNLTQMVEEPTGKPPATDVAVSIEQPIVKIEVVGLRGHFFKYAPPRPAPKSLMDRAAEITKEAYFQRQRFNETAQPMEIDRDHIYYRRDAFSYTKGIIFRSFCNRRIDFGLYKGRFAPATTYISGRVAPYFDQEDTGALLFRNGARVFFSLRVRIPTP